MRRTVALAGLLACFSSAGMAQTAPLSADGLVLVVNKQQPAGRELAVAYAAARGVPDGRIIEIDVPDLVEIAPEFYDKSIASVVRTEIESRNLRAKTQCVVLFYGVPLRVRDRTPHPSEASEVKDILEPGVQTLLTQLLKSVEQTELIAKSVNRSFVPNTSPNEIEPLRARGAAAEAVIKAALPRYDEATQKKVLDQQAAARELLTRMPTLQGFSTQPPTTKPTQQDVNEWIKDSENPAARRQLRETIYHDGNVYQLLVVLETQRRSLNIGEGESSVDSELSCLWAGNYPRARWVPNPWHYKIASAPLRQQVVRVARIDGPTPEIARRVFENAIKVEATGLSGDVVLDARGLQGPGTGVGSYDTADHAIRNVARYTGGVDGIRTVFDNNDGLLPDHSSDNAAVYCGWYSVRAYKPTATYVPGSIAWHVASYEMITLRAPNEPGWCRNLMLNGADVTLGPVGEPYLLAFPPADEFLGLLFTGKASIAEAYWASIPVTSWKMVLIGDPLYRPFAKKPLITPDRLSEPLRRALPEN